MTLKYQTLKENILLLLILINLRMKYLMQGQNKIVKGLDISNIVKDFDLNTKLSTLATKAALESEQDKIVKLQTH